MTLRFMSLASGSRGNASLVEFGSTLLMIDCGLPCKIVEERLKAVDRDPRDVTAILVTHEHTDHAQGVATFTKRHNTPVWMTPGTASAMPAITRVHHLSCHRALTVGDIDVRPYPVPHDAREPCQFTFGAAGRRLGMLTDAGHVTPHMVERLTPSDPATAGALDTLTRLGMPPEHQLAFLNRLVNQQAFTLSALDLFYGSALLLVALIPLLWIARPSRRAAAAGAGAH